MPGKSEIRTVNHIKAKCNSKVDMPQPKSNPVGMSDISDLGLLLEAPPPPPLKIGRARQVW